MKYKHFLYNVNEGPFTVHFSFYKFLGNREVIEIIQTCIYLKIQSRVKGTFTTCILK